MAKGASTEPRMGKLHNQLTELFLSVLKRYDANMTALDEETLGEEMIQELLASDQMPNPAMLGAISKFLKDNSISIESEKMDELSSMEERLQAKKRNRPNLASVTNLPLINNG